MYYVYLLFSKRWKDIYIGYTAYLRKRLALHNSGKVFATKRKKPWDLIYYESFMSRSDATHREKMLKQDGRSRSWLKKRIQESLKGAA